MSCYNYLGNNTAAMVLSIAPWIICGCSRAPQVGPQLEIRRAPEQQEMTNQAPILFDVHASVPVTGLTPSAMSLTDPTLGAQFILTMINPSEYRLSIPVAPAHDGKIEPAIAAGACFDTRKVPNAATVCIDGGVVFDTSPPVLYFSVPGGMATHAEELPVKAVWSEPVRGFDPGAIRLTNTELTDFTAEPGDAAFDFVLHPLADGRVTLAVAENAVLDVAGNGNLLPVETSFTFDATPPTVIIQKAEPAGSELAAYEVTFSEPVNSFYATNVQQKGTASGVVFQYTSSAPERYHLGVVSVLTGGTIIPLCDTGAAMDLAGNPSVPATGPEVVVSK